MSRHGGWQLSVKCLNYDIAIKIILTLNKNYHLQSIHAFQHGLQRGEKQVFWSKQNYSSYFQTGIRIHISKTRCWERCLVLPYMNNIIDVVCKLFYVFCVCCYFQIGSRISTNIQLINLLVILEKYCRRQKFYIWLLPIRITSLRINRDDMYFMY